MGKNIFRPKHISNLCVDWFTNGDMPLLHVNTTNDTIYQAGVTLIITQRQHLINRIFRLL